METNNGEKPRVKKRSIALSILIIPLFYSSYQSEVEDAAISSLLGYKSIRYYPLLVLLLELTRKLKSAPEPLRIVWTYILSFQTMSTIQRASPLALSHYAWVFSTVLIRMTDKPWLNRLGYA